MANFSIKRVLGVVVVVVALAVIMNAALDSKPLMFLASLKSGGEAFKIENNTGTSTAPYVGPKVSTTEVWETNFGESPLSYEDPGLPSTFPKDVVVKVALTSVRLGKYVLSKPVMIFLNTYGRMGQVGEEFFGLTLKFKAIVPGTRCYINPLFRRFFSDTGDLKFPTIDQLSFQSCVTDATLDAEVMFAVSESDREFIITNGGLTPIFFKLTALPDHTIKFEKIETPEQYKGKAIGLSEAQTKPAQINSSKLQIKLTYPDRPISVVRGETISIQWDVLSGTNQGIIFMLSGTSTEGASIPFNKPTPSFKSADKMGTTTITVPPGEYILQQQVYPLASSPNAVKITVAGPKPSASAKYSEFYFDDYDSIIADGYCKTMLTIDVQDEYDYQLKDALISIQSSRGNSDLIVRDPDFPEHAGAFLITSKIIGTSTLTAVINGTELPQKLLLKVLDPSANNCPSSVGSNSGY